MSEPRWERWAARMARSVERRIAEGRARLGPLVPRQVVPYRGFGNAHEVFVTGRVLANPAPGPVDRADGWLRNLQRAFDHLESDEVPGARVRINFGGRSAEALTDEEGYFRTWLTPGAIEITRLWHDATVDVLARDEADGTARSAAHGAPSGRYATAVRATTEILVPTPAAEFGVISDLDDTVIRTDATRLLPMLKRTLLENEYTRLPFPGVAAFYNALHAGRSGVAQNPVFYVSSSPWNLYTVLTAFLSHQTVPAGPILLRDWGITERGVLPTRHGEHKRGAIRQIMGCYPSMPFILIGDSGQEDPEIYRDIVHESGDRILAVYIRNVSTDPARIRAIGELAEEVKLAGSELLLSDDTLAGARHAADRGWVAPTTVAEVAAAVSSSAKRPG
jgi:phosphatidate phosphatase APP1